MKKNDININIEKTTPIISITPIPEIYLNKANLDYKYKKRDRPKIQNKKYKITIELSIISSNSEEWSDEYNDVEHETTDDSDDEFQKEIKKDDIDVENMFKQCFC